MAVSNVTYMKIEYIRFKHAKWMVWSFNLTKKLNLDLSSLYTKQKRLSVELQGFSIR
ncbi:hypothetical protein LDENG_00264490 [Lucifuga dentata]|nr:hypothetical protein LDENG_00264490 [Lucifuga dentata]